LALELNIKQDISKKIIDKISKLENVPISEIRNIEVFIQNELDLKSNRAKLQEDINALGDEFYTKLLEKHPNLTSNDLKLCTLVVLNLPNKEIAISKNISTNSVKVVKNRLKKKLNLNTETKLNQYLKDFLL